MPSQFYRYAIALVLFVLPFLAQTATFTPILPPSYPLAARNPYLSAWLPGNQAANLPSAVAQFWNGQLLTWSVLTRVDDTTYSLFGVPSPGDGVKPATLVSADFTATHTTFVLDAGDARIVLDFLSPISPHDHVRQSAPYSYLTVSSSVRADTTPKVQIYSDMDNSWMGQFGQDIKMTWNWESSNGGTQMFVVHPQGEASYSEAGDMALWGSAVYCTRENGSKLTAKVGNADEVRAEFTTSAAFTDGWNFRPGSVFALSHDLGSLVSTENVTFVIGNVRDNAINYLDSDRSDFFRGTCNTIACGCAWALDDYAAADAEARTFDAMIASKGFAIGGQNYSDILALSARQAFASMELTIPAESLDANDILAFVKEISSDGNVNTLDVIMPMAPIFYVLAPDYIRMLLLPIMHYLQSGSWPHKYAIHDIGALYPNATGHNDGNAEPMPVEECGNLLTLVYMYELATGDKTWKQQFIGLFQEYADYLLLNGEHPDNQLSTDDGAGSKANQTGLAIKSAIALNAFGVMTNQARYTNAGKTFATNLYTNREATDAQQTHFTLIQGEEESWGLQFNLYLDVLLKLNTFPSKAYAMATRFYPSVRRDAGVPLDSAEDWGKTDWMIFAAATGMAEGVKDEGVRDMFIDDVHAFMENGVNDVPFSDKYFVYGEGQDRVGGFDGYKARPVVGGHFALLALEGADQFPMAPGRKVKRQASSDVVLEKRSGSYGI